jgi:hypothetical protein
MVDLFNAQQTADLLGITLNNLRQITFRKKISVTERRGRAVYYSAESIELYKARKNIITKR